MNNSPSDLKFPVMYEPGENDPHPIQLSYREGDFAVWVLDHGYEVLATADGRVITEITEPEDRNFQRDLRPIVTELAALRAKAAAYDEVMCVVRHMKENADKFFYCGPEDIDDCEMCATRGRIEQLIDDERRAGRYIPRGP